MAANGVPKNWRLLATFGPFSWNASGAHENSSSADIHRIWMEYDRFNVFEMLIEMQMRSIIIFFENNAHFCSSPSVIFKSACQKHGRAN